MYSTYKLLKPLVDKNLDSYSLEELAFMYQQNSESRILATSYCKIYRLAIMLSNKYWGLTEADVASFCLEKLDMCLLTYQEGSAFTTYFGKVFCNKLREETENLNRKKRKCILESINDLINVGVEDTYNLIEMMLPANLTSKERTLCIMESQGYDRKDVASELNVSRMTIHNMEKSLQVKLSPLRNC